MSSQKNNLKRLKFCLDIIGISSLLIFIGLIIKNGYVKKLEIGFNLTGISLYVGAPLFIITILCGIGSEILKKVNKS